MPSYRFYRVDHDGHILNPPEILQFVDDAEASRHAEQIIDGEMVEVWDERRMVARLHPKK